MKRTPKEQREFDRARINEADPVAFLISVMRGEPVPLRDEIGAVVGYQRSDDLALRTAAADRLLKRIVPELKSIEATTETGVTFKIVSPFDLPGSRRANPTKSTARLPTSNSSGCAT